MRKVAVYLSAALLCIALESFAYESVPFRNGGSIEGVIEYVGATIPEDPVLTVSSDTQYCGTSVPAQKYLIRRGKVQNVIVYLKDIRVGKAVPGGPVTVESRNCRFEPHVAVGFKGKTIVMKTDDPVFHTFDVHASLTGKEIFHVALHQRGSSVTKTLSSAGLLELRCYVHPWQHSYVYVFDHPYAAVSDEMGKFSIGDIPPGTYTVEAWHEALGYRELANVKVESGKTSNIKLEYAAR